MNQARHAARVAAVSIFACLALASSAFAQADSASRRGAGIRIGAWDVQNPDAELTTYAAAPHFEGYFQRGLDEHMALESTAGVWHRTARTIQPTTGNVIEIRTYVIPLFTSLKIFPVTDAGDVLEPFLMLGAGFALGIDAVSDNAIGGGGTSIATGFGIKGGAGIEYDINDVFGVVISARYQLIDYGDPLGGTKTFKGIGFEGGITYRFPL